MIPSSRKEAKETGSKFYFTGKECKNGHVSKRYTNCGRCLDCCSSIYGDNSYEKRKLDPKRKAYMKNYLASYYQEKVSTHIGIDKVRAESRASYARNIEKERDRSAKKRRENHVYYYQKCAERRARKKRATPSWLSKESEKVKLIYSKAKELGLEVDHIVPLQSDIVCGLHCFDNLQLLSRSENAIKSNRKWPDMPDITPNAKL